MEKFTLSLKIYACIGVCMCFLAFSTHFSPEEEANYLQQKLSDHYDPEPGGKNIKKYELHVTDKGFCRYKRVFNSGKVEYFSCNLIKFRDMDYLGNTRAGTLLLRTKGEDVIVQTYNESRGDDIDSMATYMAIPLKNLEAEDLIDLSVKLHLLSSQLRQ